MSSRNPFEARAVTSRRGGPVKAPLSRDAIVVEALRQLTTVGIDGMSLRKVAAALDTGAASLYAYVTDLRELHALVLDRALATVKVSGAAKGSWRERLVKVLDSYAHALSARPGLAQLAFGTVAVGPNALRIMDAMLAILEEGGVDQATAAWAIDLLLLQVTASVAEHANGLDPAHPDGAVARAVASVSAGDYPHVYAARADLLSGTARERSAWALNVLLTGITQTRGSRKARSSLRPKSRRPGR